MSGASREASLPLTRWQYFTKNLYRNAANETRFTYNKVIYNKSAQLQEIEGRSARVNAVLLLLLLIMFVLADRWHSIAVVVFSLVAAVVGEAIRLFMLPRDIRAHLEDSGYRER